MKPKPVFHQVLFILLSVELLFSLESCIFDHCWDDIPSNQCATKCNEDQHQCSRCCDNTSSGEEHDSCRESCEQLQAPAPAPGSEPQALPELPQEALDVLATGAVYQYEIDGVLLSFDAAGNPLPENGQGTQTSGDVGLTNPYEPPFYNTPEVTLTDFMNCFRESSASFERAGPHAGYDPYSFCGGAFNVDRDRHVLAGTSYHDIDLADLAQLQATGGRHCPVFDGGTAPYVVDMFLDRLESGLQSNPETESLALSDFPGLPIFLQCFVRWQILRDGDSGTQLVNDINAESADVWPLFSTFLVNAFRGQDGDTTRTRMEVACGHLFARQLEIDPFTPAPSEFACLNNYASGILEYWRFAEFGITPPSE